MSANIVIRSSLTEGEYMKTAAQRLAEMQFFIHNVSIIKCLLILKKDERSF